MWLIDFKEEFKKFQQMPWADKLKLSKQLKEDYENFNFDDSNIKGCYVNSIGTIFVLFECDDKELVLFKNSKSKRNNQWRTKEDVGWFLPLETIQAAVDTYCHKGLAKRTEETIAQ